MAEIIKRNRKEWLIFHCNAWLRELTAYEIELVVLESQKLQMKDIGVFTQKTSLMEAKIAEAELYVKVIEKLLTNIEKNGNGNS